MIGPIGAGLTRRRTVVLALLALGGAAAWLFVFHGPGGGQASEVPGTAMHQQSPGDQGGEANRGGPSNPVAEQVEDRAYPRSYVSDRRALAGERSFKSLPSRLEPSDFHSKAQFDAAQTQAASTQSWQALGPANPHVAKQATQFYDPTTDTGTPTSNSGRVTALAVDPNCGKAGQGCRLWVAAAGGGIWRTGDALTTNPVWHKPPSSLPTNSFGSLIVDPNDKTGNTLYAGSGEPNGSGDSEAGLGLFKSTDGGKSWHLVKGSRKVSIDRSIGSIAIPPGHPDTIYIGTDVARHGSASVNGGRRTPPNAPALGLYKSTDGGLHFHVLKNLQSQTPPNPTPPSTGVDWFQGGVNNVQLDPHHPSVVYAALFGYGLWRSVDGGKTWAQVFQTLNPADTFGDRTEFDLVKTGKHTRIYLGDSSDDLGVAEFWRVNKADTKAAAVLLGAGDNAGWTKISDPTNGTNGYLSYNYCQNGQCGYDDFVVSPPGQPGTVWLGGSMAYDELPLYGGTPRSNGRAVIRSTNANAPAPDVTFQDMTQDAQPPGTREGMHPDQHAIAFDPKNPGIAFVGSDGGVIRVNVTNPQDVSSQCDSRGLAPADLTDCHTLLSGIPSKLKVINDGLNTIQFQSLSYNPDHPTGQLQGGTQDNGTFSYSGSPTWIESVGGDGGQSGFDAADPTIRYHNYFDATPDVNFHGDDPSEWLAIYYPLYNSNENRSFYIPFTADPNVGGRAFAGLESVWRTDDNGGDQATLEAHCNELHLDPNFTACGDWQPLATHALTSSAYGTDRTGQFVVATVRAPSDNGTLWAATRIGRVFVSKNVDDSQLNKVTFNRIDSSSTPGRFVSGIAVDPNDANHAFISYSGYSAYTPTTPGHVFDVTYDPTTKTATFTDISHDLGDQPVTGIAFDAATGDLYAATDFGVARLPAGATHWETAAPGMPRVAVYGLTLANTGGGGRVLYAATHGRGAYSLTLP